jgi:1,4-dihydroxy-2-naphthoyl-CoA hydrolase
MSTSRPLPSLERINEGAAGSFVELMGIVITGIEDGRLTSELQVRAEVMAPNGYLHAATVVALADTTCGYGARTHRPEGSTGFTTIELKTNFLGTVRDGWIDCEATLQHAGRTTQVWDARVTARASGRAIALFRCTQMLLYPKPE